MVVADPAFVECRRSRGLNPPDQAVLSQDTEGVVHRLTRNRPDFGANGFGNAIRRAVRMARHRPQHGQSLGRNLHSTLTKQRGRIVNHDYTLRRNVDTVQTLIYSSLCRKRSLRPLPARAAAPDMKTDAAATTAQTAHCLLGALPS